MTPAAHTDAKPPEPPAEIIGLVLHGREPIITPAIQKVKESLARFGYAHSDLGTLLATEVAAAKLLVVHGLVVDTFYPNTKEGRAAWKASQR